MRNLVRFAAVFLLGILPAPVLAAPLSQATQAIAISPSTVQPGQAVHVTVSGFTAPNRVNTSACLGVLGPGRNVELGRSPAFRPRVGTIAIGANGTGQTDVQIPADLVSGSYQFIVGGCAPQPSLAPLVTFASTTLSVVTPTPAPPKLPTTGGLPRAALLVVVACGTLALGTGLYLKRREGSSC
ncbi:MAG TPA: hypothetical protein VNL16_16705 [Chloroflexota bacterium]|nr:hypothetical protein [Chloroflexota bacterium]